MIHSWAHICTLLVIFAGHAHAQVVVWPGNGHGYEVVLEPGSWLKSQSSASQRMYSGMSGHLAAINSDEESRFLTATYGTVVQANVDAIWTGGLQKVGAAEPDGGWGWSTGEPLSYVNWDTFEPNNAFGTEDRIVLRPAPDSFLWNDVTGSWQGRGFIVEYGPVVPLEEVFWVGDQATCDGAIAPLAGSFHHGNNWLNYTPPHLLSVPAEAVFELNHVTPGGTNSGTTNSSPRYIYFGDFLDQRLAPCSSVFVGGGPAQVDALTMSSGQWTFDFSSPDGPTDGYLSVIDSTLIAYQGGGGLSPVVSLSLKNGVMSSGSVRIGGIGAGILEVSSTAILDSQMVVVHANGQLIGDGTASGNVIIDGGRMDPGFSPGTFTINGDFELTATSLVRIGIGGHMPTHHDRIVAGEDILLAGTVQIDFVDAFVPMVGDQFELFRAGSVFNDANAQYDLPSGYEISSLGSGLFQITAVPEPSLTMLVVLGLMSCMRCRMCASAPKTESSAV